MFSPTAMSYEDYTSSKVWIPLYAEAFEQILASRDWLASRVFLALVRRVDKYGLCYTSINGLAKLAGSRSDAVITALKRLFEWGWVKGQVLPDELGMGERYYFQVSPFMLRIRPEFFDRVVALWLKGQKTYEPPQAEKAEKGRAKQKQAKEAVEADRLKQKQAEKAEEADIYPKNADNAKNSYTLPKTQVQVERLASQIAADFAKSRDRTSTYKQMLCHISDFGYERVEEAYMRVKGRMAGGSKIASPAGLLVTILRSESKSR